jgi:biopolymer transport protein ExbD
MPASGTSTVSRKWDPKLEIIINDDGDIWLEKAKISTSQFRAFALAVAKISSEIRLIVRAVKNVEVTDIRKVIKVWGKAGFSDVIFGSVFEDPRKALKNEAGDPALRKKVGSPARRR